MSETYKISKSPLNSRFWLSRKRSRKEMFFLRIGKSTKKIRFKWRLLLFWNSNKNYKLICYLGMSSSNLRKSEKHSHGRKFTTQKWRESTVEMLVCGRSIKNLSGHSKLLHKRYSTVSLYRKILSLKRRRMWTSMIRFCLNWSIVPFQRWSRL